MAPEAVMLLIDSSEYMRNGDFLPTRFEAQSDAISVLFSSKINSNPENTVGVMTMGGAGGKGPEVLATPTADLGKVLSATHNAHVGGESDLATAINVAQLALKHRQNKTQRQRIIILIGSPLTSIPSSASSPSDYEKELIKLGKKLKKNNVAVDVVCFAGGDQEEGDGSMNVDGGEGSEETGLEGTLKRFVESVGSGENSHFLSVSPGLRLLSDMIVSSPILAGEDAYGGQGGAFESGAGEGGSGGGGGGGGNFEFGVDPDMDPELAMVLRMSMEEEQARLAAASSSSAPSTSSSVPDPSATLIPPPSQPAIAAPITQASGGPSSAPILSAGGPTDADNEGDEELRQALALSAGADAGEDVAMSAAHGEEDEDEEDEEEAMRQAIQMSLKEEEDKK